MAVPDATIMLNLGTWASVQLSIYLWPKHFYPDGCCGEADWMGGRQVLNGGDNKLCVFLFLKAWVTYTLSTKAH